jgi:hypothetical protein
MTGAGGFGRPATEHRHSLPSVVRRSSTPAVAKQRIGLPVLFPLFHLEEESPMKTTKAIFLGTALFVAGMIAGNLGISTGVAQEPVESSFTI